jgi:hypothetical protein
MDPEPPQEAAMSEKNVPSAARIRIDIDRGLEGDKIAHPDPAAAPLETDAESAGAAPTREERALAAIHPTFAAVDEVGEPPGGGAVVTWKAALIAVLGLLIAGVLLVSLRLRQIA